MLSYEEALQKTLRRSQSVDTEVVSIFDSLNRVLAEDINSQLDMPPFDRSLMDGYACRKDDLGKDLLIVETIPAGYVPRKKILEGQCAKIMTGGVVPEGADAIFIVEDTIKVGRSRVRSKHTDIPDYIAKKGSDYKPGTTLIESGTKIDPQQMAIMASIGVTEVKVKSLPKVGVIATGSELVEPSEDISAGKIRNSNSTQLIAQLKKMGIKATYYGIVEDDFDKIYATMKKATSENNVVLLTGGVSMGDMDYVPGVMEKLGLEIVFDRVAIKPGKPTTLAVSEDVTVFGLPGNPVATFVIFEFFVKPYLYKAMDYEFSPTVLPLKLGQTISRKIVDRESYVPVVFDKEGVLYPLRYHGSAHIDALNRAQGFISYPQGVSQLEEGSVVNVRLL